MSTTPADTAPAGLTFTELVTEEPLDPGQVSFGSDGLVPAVVQDVRDGAVLMVAHMNEESLRRTLETGRTWFWSRSRKELWPKGETSGERQDVHEIRVDCDADVLIVIVTQHGQGACHTGNRSCFYRRLEPTPKRAPET